MCVRGADGCSLYLHACPLKPGWRCLPSVAFPHPISHCTTSPTNPSPQALLFESVDRQTGKEQGWSRGVGAGTDSYYEYLIKYWVLGGSQDEHFRARWEQATDEALATLMVYPPGWPFSYLGDLRAAEVDTVLEHLRCFYPGGCACVRLRVGLCVGEMELLPVAARQQPWRALAPITPRSALPTHPLPPPLPNHVQAQLHWV